MSLHVFGGYAVPLANLGGNSNWNTNTEPDRYSYMKSGIPFGADFRYFFNSTKRKLGIGLTASYTMFSTGDLSTTVADVTYTGKITLNDIKIGSKLEYDFMPQKKSNFFVDLDLAVHMLGGKTTSTAAGFTDQTMNNATRFGLGIGLGYDYMFSKGIGIVLNAKFDYINLLGKQDNTAVTPDANTYYLTDKAYTRTNPDNTTTALNAMYLMDVSFTVGLLFDFGDRYKPKVKK